MSETVPPSAGQSTADTAPSKEIEPSPNHHTPAAAVSTSSTSSQNVPPPSNPLVNSSPSIQAPQAQPPAQQLPQQQHLSQHMDPVHQLQHYQPPSTNSHATMNQNQLSLPPIQSIESHSQTHQIPQAHSQAPVVSSAINTPMNMPPPNIPQYYTMAGTIPSADPYPIVGEPNRGLSSGRHKKEVKRRTKTGCLTCRKRRIKCDERHPVCRNCEKSKRDCLGYDPVFRPQPGPSALQPAPSQPSLLVSPQGTPSYISAQSHLAGGQSFAHPPLPTTSPSSSPSVHQFDYGTAIDPALEGVASPNTATHNTSERGQIPASIMYGAESLELKPVKVVDLLSVRGHLSPPPEITTIPAPRVEEIKLVYISYAVAIDKFLECNWFETKGMVHLLANPRLLSYYSALLDGFNDRNIHDPAVLARVESLEASVIWETLTLTRVARSKEPDTNGNGTTTNTTDVELLYAVKRLAVFEALITGSHLETNPVSLDSYPECDPAHRLPGIGNQIKAREVDFWESVGRYLTISQDDPNAQKQKEEALTTCRGLLDTFENRDVIYSIVIVRHIAKFQPRKLKQTTASTDEKDAAAKLYVAVRFLEDESHGKGTNQVIKRLCGMVVKYWEDSQGGS
ncbi:hypothetical protein GX50_06987 [[Emmonsia] crescens]|uniref:Zn(2)-C6 fungal-type domain-containing protein n=1 Tax=[Emmonsia] crescens TaxID=73230 RepID=A0A2B7ZAI7_9EURO|nr:hypothetical protein GX50_06987 [Emmonsia crescens]